MTNPTPHGQVPEALEDFEVRKLAAIGAVRTSSGLVERRPIEYRRELEDQFVRGFRAAEKRLSALSAAPADEDKVRSVIGPLLNEFGERQWQSGAKVPHKSIEDAFDAIVAAVTSLVASPTPPAEQQAQPGAVYAELPQPDSWFHFTAQFWENKLRDFADRTHALRMEQAAPKAAPGESRWWRKRADEIEAQVALTGSPDAMRCFTDMRTLLQDATDAAPGDALDEVMRERDEAEDFINELLDEVLGADRPEWSSAYNRHDAMSDVRERITALHKPAVDKAWGQFQSAMAAPQQEAQEPVGEVQHLHELNDSWLNKLPIGTKLYTAPQPAPAPLSDDVVRDAARYRWLRDTSNADDPSHMIALHIRDEQNDASLSGIDAAIDAALAAQKGTP